MVIEKKNVFFFSIIYLQYSRQDIYDEKLYIHAHCIAQHSITSSSITFYQYGKIDIFDRFIGLFCIYTSVVYVLNLRWFVIYEMLRLQLVQSLRNSSFVGIFIISIVAYTILLPHLSINIQIYRYIACMAKIKNSAKMLKTNKILFPLTIFFFFYYICCLSCAHRISTQQFALW